MDLNSFFTKNWPHFAAIAFIFIVAAVFYKPQLDGFDLKRHDVEQWKGAGEELRQYHEENDEYALWTNSMFGGMPSVQITLGYPGNVIKEMTNAFYRTFRAPMGLLIMHLIGFYIFALFLRIKPLIALLGAIAFSFASYEIIIVQAGHMTKSGATALLAPALGAFIYSYRSKNLWGVLLTGLFMALEISANHLQVTYYFAFLLLALGIYFFIQAIREKEIMSFIKITAGIVAGIVVAVIINSGNILLTNDYAKHTIRGANDLTMTPTGADVDNKGGGLDKDYITNWSYGIGETATLISPNVKGGGSFQLGGSQFETIVDDSDFNRTEQTNLKRMYAYWGEQPITSGPVYLGIIVSLLAFLGLIFMKGKIKWPLFVITVLAVMLSWGKNFMGLTDFFIDYVPGYNKFRTVTIILVIVELTVAVMGVLFLNELIKNRKEIKKEHMLIAVSAFTVFILGVKFVGLGDNYWSQGDQRQLDGIENSIKQQLASQDPATIKANIGLDVNNPAQVDQFIDQQMEGYEKDFNNLKSIREDIFHSSMNRSLLFLILGGGLIVMFVYLSFSQLILTGGLLLLTMADLIPVSADYIRDEERFWVAKEDVMYPISSRNGDELIMSTELAANPALKSKIDAAEREAKSMAVEEELSGGARKNLIDAYRFHALNMGTNYRVFDLNGGFGSSKASYFHKSLGGYHGAKLRNIANVIDYHLGTMNEKVYDMLNVKYFLQQTEQGHAAIPRASAMGPCWLVKEVETHETPDDEIRALGNKFELENIGGGSLLVNGEPTNKVEVFGGETLQYLVASGDTMDVPIRAGLKEGEEAALVMDVRGTVNLVPTFTLEADTANSFTKFVRYKVLNEFRPKEEAVMLKSEAEKLSTRKFSGEGTISMEKYGLEEITYTADVKGKQFAVFSEIYYPEGWTAYVDGKEAKIVKTNYLLRGIEIPNGKHKITFSFDLPAYHRANNIALIGSLILILAFVAAGFLEIRKMLSKKENKEDELDEAKA